MDLGLDSTLIGVSSLIACFISYNKPMQSIKVFVESPLTLDQSKMNQHIYDS